MIKNFLLNLLLSLVWVALTGHLNYTNFMFGFIMGFFILWMLSRASQPGERHYFYRVPKIILFILSFFYDMLRANIEVTREIMTPDFNMTPGIIAFEHNLKTDFEITMITNFIALTPGTMVLKISDDKKILYIHGLYIKDKEKFIEKMRNGLEKKLIEILR
ncbi:MAG: Na+/H+ antiporter subunit E [Weeksellaceae bacterium]|jgi:multicomponent Na+:H+ antiporter subunit E|nr:Na+/H+ antiporter subunit E [Weeksellaceae bacterium]